MEDSDRFTLEKEIKSAVEIGTPCVLDDLIEEVCGDHTHLAGAGMEIVVDEHHRWLKGASRQAMLESYRKSYVEQTGANKDWLLGEVVEEIIQKN